MNSDLWTSEAKQAIEEKELDKHFKSNKKHYYGLAEGAMHQLKVAAGQNADLQRGDLYNVLQELLTLDAKLLKELKAADVSDARRGTWVKRFTNYVIDEYWNEKVEE